MARIFRKSIKRSIRRPYNKRRKTNWRRYGTGRLKFHKSPFPSVMYTTLKYADLTTIVSNDTDGIYTYRVNSLYDVDFTSTGKSPRLTTTLLGQDGGVQPYGSYRVISCDYFIRMTNANSSGNSTGICGVHVRNADSSAITPINVEQLGEVPFTKYAMLTGSGSGNSQKVFKGHIDVKKFFANKQIADVTALGAEYNNNPSEVVLLDVMYRTLNASGTSYNCQCEVYFKFNVQLYDRNLTEESSL